MDIFTLLVLIVFPGIIGAILHFRLVKRPIFWETRMLIYVSYGFGLFELTLVLKFLRGWGGANWSELGKVGTLTKYGLLEVVVAVFVPLLLSLLYSMVKKFWPNFDLFGGADVNE